MRILKNRKRLNNKGFTLIELLAVVVILAVVMGIAMTQVLSAMNKSRGGSLEDSALTIAQAFNQKYTESLVDGVPSKVYGGSASEPLGASAGYNFQSDAVYYLDKALADTFNISEKGYAFINSATSDNVDAITSTVPTTALTSTVTVKNSFVTFTASTGKFVVCLFANKDGSYYVDNYKEDADTNIITIGTGSTAVTVNGAAGTMYACSDGGTRSW
ncbi:MAG: prepilin-type N-terminal cleavage/methylation domain-containing protein [Bacilli bacterium]